MRCGRNNVDILILAWKNLWRNRRRSLITLTALSLSLMLMQGFHNLAVGSYARMIDNGVRAGSGHIALYRGDYNRSRNEALTFAAGNLLKPVSAMTEVEHVLPRVYLPGLAQSSRESRGILLTGIAPPGEASVNPFLRQLEAGNLLDSSEGRGALLGSRLASELKLTVGNKLVITVQNRQGDLTNELFRIRGIVHTGLRDVDGSLVMVGLDKAASMGGFPGEIHELALILNRSGSVSEVMPELTALLQQSPVHAVAWDIAMPNLANSIKLDYASQKFIFAIMLLIVTIGVINTMLMSVMERVREFGIILAIGAAPGRLFRMILAEGLVMGTLSVVTGSLLGSLLTWYLADHGIDLRRLMPQSMEFGGVIFDPVLRAIWDLPWMAKISLYLLGLALAATLYPAIKAARLAPAEAMRHI
jgi:ABC-type lipoprotein release transport system permease subunit